MRFKRSQVVPEEFQRVSGAFQLHFRQSERVSDGYLEISGAFQRDFRDLQGSSMGFQGSFGGSQGVPSGEFKESQGRYRVEGGEILKSFKNTSKSPRGL